jgi:hypothetical protein
MKKIVLAALFMAGIVASTNAQKGSILLYGNTSFGTQNNDGGTYFSLNPGVGYQFSNQWTAGVDLGMGTAKSATPSYQAGAFLRYTQPINETFSIYEQLGIGYLHQGQAGGYKQAGYAPYGLDMPFAGSGSNGMYAAVSLPTISINVKNGFAANLGFGSIGFASMKPDAGSSVSKFSFNFGDAISVGISKNFGGVKSDTKHHREHRENRKHKG